MSEWIGVTKAKTYNEKIAEYVIDIFDNADCSFWNEVFEKLSNRPNLINSVRLDSDNYDTLLHISAKQNRLDIYKSLKKMGAWVTVTNDNGTMPFELFENHQKSQEEIVLFEKYFKQIEEVNKIEKSFHELVIMRTGNFIKKHSLRLPQISTLFEISDDEMWFPIPGFYGGFNFKFENIDNRLTLSVASWSRVIGGSSQSHRINSSGCIKVYDEEIDGY